MYVEDIFKFSLNSILHRRLRSFLTVLGIIIGIATVVALLSIGAGLQQTVTSQLSQLGGNLIIIEPGHTRAGGGTFFGATFERTSSITTLTQSDVQAIQSVAGVQAVTGIIEGSVSISFNRQTASSTVIGVQPGVWQIVQQINLQSGRYLSDSDISSVVVGSRVANSLFKKNVTLNSRITINNSTFTVIGILQQTGGAIGGTSDNSVIVLQSTARNLLPSIGSNEVSLILAKASESADPNQVANNIEQKLILTHHVTTQTEDFTVISAQTIQSSISSVTSSISLFLGGIAAISLLVGSIGIANTMFTSVVERTRQIGVLKALGMKSREVMLLFLIESALMGLLGGIIGSGLGVVASQLISQLGGSISAGGAGAAGGLTAFRTYVSPLLIFEAIAFSIFIGAISGLLPARQASKLEPVEALRYE